MDFLQNLPMERLLAGAVVLIVMGVFALALLRRSGGKAASLELGAYGIVRVVPLGGKERVAVIQLGAKQVALGVSPGRVTMLCELGRSPGLRVVNGAEPSRGA